MKLSVRFIKKRVMSELTYQVFFDLNKPSMAKMCIQA